MKNLPQDHRLRRNENVFPFAANLASLEVLQAIALCTGAAGIDDFGAQRFRYVPGIMDQLPGGGCKPGCPRATELARADRNYSLIGRDIAAERSRGLALQR